VPNVAPVSRQAREYTERLMDMTPQSSGITEEFLALLVDPEWDCEPYYSTTRLTATIKPVGDMWNTVESRCTPARFVAIAQAARLANMTTKDMLRAVLAIQAFHVMQMP
jgi:hypothetical protein